ncbi:hypothetical protein I3760_16G001200 [Carya illinoinensis]|uniref:HMG box domain-containing protein n=1 Tax=Carya illinoinensis TaxID=32201 RepID=A0A8T1N191_CARIL|nr:high mobility group B protein 7 [Carya illinoinensis]KAG2662842.1 hypothetical protein I3760_16G001200 [Carya illinoinensis]KAG6624076.1 hypothetical protein CIPAW_16G001200 [Carya illinoinensis]KAG6671370.1 hypothetical protein I3842_16G001300 [Carya illinoinensis]
MATIGGVKGRKRVEASSESQTATSSLLRAKDGSAFARCEECNKNVPVALISMHSCSLDAKIKLNLEAQVVEMSTESKKKPADRKKIGTAGPKAKKAKAEKKVKKGKDPSMPKRPPTAFFLFMDDFRKAYKEAHPDSKDVKVVAKEGGEKWRTLTEEEKKVYQDKASDLKTEYEQALENHNAEDEDGDGGSEKEVEGASDGAPEKEVEGASDGE